MNTDREVPVELAVQNVSVAYNNGHVALYDASSVSYTHLTLPTNSRV